MPVCPDCADPLCRRFGCISDQDFTSRNYTTERDAWVCPSCSVQNSNDRDYCRGCGNRAPAHAQNESADAR